MMTGAGYAVGVWLQGSLADRVGVRLVTAGSALVFLALVLSHRWLRPHVTKPPALLGGDGRRQGPQG